MKPFLLIFIMIASNGMAQTIEDQNMRFAESRDKYAKTSGEKILSQGQTIDELNAAYDWSKMREDWKFNRRARRYERQIEIIRNAPKYVSYNYGYGVNRYNDNWGAQPYFYRNPNQYFIPFWYFFR